MKKLDVKKPLRLEDCPEATVTYLGRNERYPKRPLAFAVFWPGQNWFTLYTDECGLNYLGRHITNPLEERWVPVYAFKDGSKPPYYGKSCSSYKEAEEASITHTHVMEDVELISIQKIEEQEDA
jgi:hypothetical protein